MTFVSIMDTLRGQAPSVPIKPARSVSPATPKTPTPPPKAQPAARAPPRAPAAKPVQQPRKPAQEPAKPAKPARSVPTKPKPVAAPKPRPRQTPSPEPTSSSSAPRKKLSFKDVMKQGRSVDKSKLEVTIRTRKPPSQSTSKRLHNKRDPQRGADGSIEAEGHHTAKEGRHRDLDLGKEQAIGSRHNSASRGSERHHQSSTSSSTSASAPAPALSATTSTKSKLHKSAAAPAPAARPSAELLKKLESRKRGSNPRSRSGHGYDSEEDDLSDFVEEDEDEIDPYGGIGQRRYREDFSDSDMDATGGDVFEEEQRSMARARREDREEEMRLEELAKRKRQRRG